MVGCYYWFNSDNTCIGYGFYTIISIVGPLRKGVQFAKSLGSGDLMSTVDINQSDEIGNWLTHSGKWSIN